MFQDVIAFGMVFSEVKGFSIMSFRACLPVLFRAALPALPVSAAEQVNLRDGPVLLGKVGGLSEGGTQR